MRATTLIAGSAFVGLIAALPLGLAQAEGVATRSDVMPVSEVKRGMKGYGLTVFEGTKPEKFDVEIIDVLHNFQPRQELILVKTTHPRLEVAKVVAGMSGSPIYLGGKMVGAYAYGWSFGSEPVAGVTPIRNMLDDIERPLPKTIDGWPLAILPQARGRRTAAHHISTETRFAGALNAYDVAAHAAQIGKGKRAHEPAEGSIVAPVSTPLLMGGLTPGAIDASKSLFAPLGLEPMQAGTGSGIDPSAPERFVDGGAIGVELIRGDVGAMGLGTVTRVEGDRLVAFGHPMMQSGVTALPTAIGKVHWFLASDMRSFKLGEAVRPVGALVNDRLASIVVSHSARAPVIPVKMSIKGVPGAPFTTWNFQVAHEKFMTPAFIAIALGNALQATAAERQDVSWNAQSKIHVKGHADIEVQDYGVSVGGTPSPGEFIQSNLVGAVGALLNNPWEPVIVESAEIEIELRYSREIYRLRGAEVLVPEIAAGEAARVRLTLVPFVGKTVQQVVSVPIPRNLAGQTVALTIVPGYMRRKERPSPDSVTDLVATLQDALYPPKSVIFEYDIGGAGVSHKGRVARNLPAGALALIRPTASSIAPESFKSDVKHVTKLPQFMVGSDRVTVVVKPVLK